MSKHQRGIKRRKTKMATNRNERNEMTQERADYLNKLIWERQQECKAAGFEHDRTEAVAQLEREGLMTKIEFSDLCRYNGAKSRKQPAEDGNNGNGKSKSSATMTVNLPGKIKSGQKECFAEYYRNCCRTGHVPDDEELAIFFPKNTLTIARVTRNNLKREKGWRFEKVEYGWMVTIPPEPPKPVEQPTSPKPAELTIIPDLKAVLGLLIEVLQKLDKS
jgi:hypothetical protein